MKFEDVKVGMRVRAEVNGVVTTGTVCSVRPSEVRVLSEERPGTRVLIVPSDPIELLDGEPPAEEATKDDTDKLRYDLIPPEVMFALSNILTFGANKYGDRNWEKSDLTERMFAALNRHLWAWRMGEDLDEESECPHLDHALCCLAMMVTYRARRKWAAVGEVGAEEAQFRANTPPLDPPKWEPAIGKPAIDLATGEIVHVLGRDEATDRPWQIAYVLRDRPAWTTSESLGPVPEERTTCTRTQKPDGLWAVQCEGPDSVGFEIPAEEGSSCPKCGKPVKHIEPPTCARVQSPTGLWSIYCAGYVLPTESPLPEGSPCGNCGKTVKHYPLNPEDKS